MTKDHCVGADLAGRLRRIEHGNGNAVLDAVPGIEEFQLGDHRRAAAFSDAVEPDQRRIADQFGDVVGDFHDWAPERNAAL
jgi:hypothetical protein